MAFMKIKLLACKVLYREIAYLSYSCPNFVDTTFLRQGFHDTPEILRKQLQSEIDKIVRISEEQED